MIALYLNTIDPETGGHTFNMLHMMDQANHNTWLQAANIRHLIWFGLFIGFAIKIPAFQTVAIISALGIIIGAAYVLWMLQRVFLGPKNDKYDDLPDIDKRELFTLVPIGILVILLGVYPMPLLDLMKVTMTELIKAVAG